MLNKAYLEITNVCNLSCSFCHKTKRERRFMSAEDFDKLTDRLRGKIQYLYFHLMGEPTLHPLLPEFIKSAHEKGFLPIITTNGSLLGERGGAIIEAQPYKVSISLHAPAGNPAFADRGYLDNCIAFAKKAALNGTYIALRLWNLGTEEERANEDTLARLREAFPEEWVDVRGGAGKRLATRIFLEYAEHFEWPNMSAPAIEKDADLFCYGLRDQVGILVDGSVVPCCLDAEGAITLGDLFESELEDILASPRARAVYDGFTARRACEELCRRCGYARRFSKKCN